MLPSPRPLLSTHIDPVNQTSWDSIVDTGQYTSAADDFDKTRDSRNSSQSELVFGFNSYTQHVRPLTDH